MKTNYPDNEEFFALPFYVDSRVLTPRNDTETMIYQVLKTLNSSFFSEQTSPPTPLLLGEGRISNFATELLDSYTLIDVGTGSSCIPVAILKNTKNQPQEAFALDISLDALEVAKINIEKHNLQDKLKLLKSDLLEVFLKDKKVLGQSQNFSPLLGGEGLGVRSFSTKNIIITANLPYIKNGNFEHMDKEVLENDPFIALFGGEETGFELYEKLIFQIFELKKIYNLEQIILFIEIGFDQKEYSQKYLKNLNLKHEYFKDLGGVDRIVKICF